MTSTAPFAASNVSFPAPPTATLELASRKVSSPPRPSNVACPLRVCRESFPGPAVEQVRPRPEPADQRVVAPEPRDVAGRVTVQVDRVGTVVPHHDVVPAAAVDQPEA